MKKILLILCIFCSFLLIPEIGFANNPTIAVEVTEKIPGANCGEANADGIYTCNITSGFSSITSIMWAIIKYFTYLTALAAVLYIVINGILYSMSGLDAGAKDTAKKRIVQTLLGLVLLFLAGTILNAIAPWVYTA